MATRLLGLVIALLALGHSSADAAEWSRARIGRLPDSAFAVVEIAPNGKKVRHLPHHNETGAVDPVHLMAALARLPQVKWLDPANKAIARRHLEEHLRDFSPKTGNAAERVIRVRKAPSGPRRPPCGRVTSGTTCSGWSVEDARGLAHSVQRPR